MTWLRRRLSRKLFRLAAKVDGQRPSGNVAIGSTALQASTSASDTTFVGYLP